MSDCETHDTTQLGMILSGYVEWYRSLYPDEPCTRDGAIVRVLDYSYDGDSYLVKTDIYHVVVPEQYLRIIA